MLEGCLTFTGAGGILCSRETPILVTWVFKKREHSTLTNTKPLNGPVGITDCGALIHTIHGGAGAGAGRLVDGRDGRGEHCTITGDFLFKKLVQQSLLLIPLQV